jgi:peptidoglycan hydrolase-like protein with peptidoglycan-binding domain
MPSHIRRHKTRRTDSSTDSSSGGRSGAGASNSAMAAALSRPTLRLGSSGAPVEQLQQDLASAGHSPNAIDGDFGPSTHQALRSFQAAKGLSADGIAGRDTYVALSGAAPGRSHGRTESTGQDQESSEGGFWSRLFGGGNSRDPGKQRPQRSGKGLELPDAGFTVPTSKIYRSGVSEAALSTALTAYNTAAGKGQTQSPIFTLVDFTKSDDEKRLWVMNLRTGEVLHHEFVSHGYGSANTSNSNESDQFGNESYSGKSSLGLMRATGSGQVSGAAGRRGTPVQRFQGLEPGFNDNVASRSVIMHQAKNGRGQYADGQGIQGNSAGCWALEPGASDRVVATIPAGALIFNYSPDRRYLETSSYLKKKLQK